MTHLSPIPRSTLCRNYLDSMESENSLRILKLRKQNNKKSVYECDSRELRLWLQSVKDMEVAVIPIVGPSRMGKSFILNYMSRYLLNPKNNDWMGRRNTPLKGFLWKAETDPQTDGIWISKPYIIEKTIDSKIAVILCDTQGVFDQFSNQRDWSTIIGLSLLISSCMIFNIFTGLQEDAFIFLESFLEYGLTATESLNMKNGKPFQNLLFLIRDWAVPQKFKYGLDGGKDYLNEKLTIEEQQNESAQNARLLLRDCFQELECFLMPIIGGKNYETNFNGSVGQLGLDFKNKLHEFITIFLNPDQIQPKRINDKNITGEEFCELFESYVSVFNSTSMDKPSNDELLSATSRIADKIHMRRIKSLHLEELKRMVESKPFLTRKELIQRCKQFNDDYIRDFEDGMYSDNNEFIDKMEDSFEQNIEIVYEINENRRIEIIEKTVDECSEYFHKLSSTQLSDVTDLIAFEDFLKSNERKVLLMFKSSYKGEEESLFFKDYLNLTENISKAKDGLRLDYTQHLSKVENLRTDFINENVELYRTEFQTILDNNTNLTKEQFKLLENQLREKSIEFFEEKFNRQESDINRFYVLDLKERLKKVKNEFKDKNEKKSKELFEKTEQLLNKLIEDFNKNLNQMIDFIENSEELLKRHKYLKDQLLQEFNKNCSYKSQEYLAPFLNQFETEINNSFENFKKILDSKIKLFQNVHDNSLDLYMNELKNVLADPYNIDQNDLDKRQRTWRRDAITYYEKQFLIGKPSENFYYKFQQQLKEKIDQEYEILLNHIEERNNQLKLSIESNKAEIINKFNQKMIKATQNMISGKELDVHLDDIRNKLTNKFIEKLNITDQVQVGKAVKCLHESMDRLTLESKEDFESRKTEIKNSFQTDVSESVNYYSKKIQQQMKQIIEPNELVQFHQKIKVEVMNDFNVNHESIFGIEPKYYEQNLKEKLDEMFEKFVNKRNKTIEIIGRTVEQQYEFYSKIMANKMTMFISDEDIENENKIVERQALEAFRQQNEFVPQNILSKNIIKLKQRINKTFIDLKKNLVLRQQNFYQSVENKMSEVSLEYKNELGHYINENKFYSIETISLRESPINKKSMLKFEQFLNQFEINNVSFIAHLNSQMEEEYNRVLERNKLNRISSDEGLQEQFQIICDEYKQEMNSNIESINRETQLIDLNERVFDQLLKKVDHIGITDIFKLDTFKESIEKELAKLYKEFEEIIKKKLINIYYKEQTKLKNNYNEKMQKHFERKSTTTEFLNEKHNEIKCELLKQFQRLFENDFEFNLDTFLAKIDMEINEVFDGKYAIFYNQQKQALKKSVDEFFHKYQKQMNQNIKTIEIQSELDEIHNKYQEQIKSEFKTHAIEYLREEEIQAFLGELDEKINSHFESSILEQWKIETRHIRPIIENLQISVSNYYQDEMKKKNPKNLYLDEIQIREYHRMISENSLKKFQGDEMFKNLSEITFLKILRECIKVAFEKVLIHNEMYRPNKAHAIGIDLGTTNTCVSYFKPSAQNKFNCVIVPNELGRRTTASVVSFRENEEVVGDVAKEETYVYPKNTIQSAKRLIGRKFNDESVQKTLKLWSYDVIDDGNNKPKIKVNVNGKEKQLYPEQISANVLKKMREISEKHLGCEVTKAVITVPAYFNDAQKKATKDAAKIVGLEVMRIINEPTAAAIAYRLDWKVSAKQKNILIYDFGGGTFDVAILAISQGEVNVMAVGGDNHLGGDDFDTNIIKYCLEEFNRKYRTTVEGNDGEKAICRLRFEVEKCKIRLSTVLETNLQLRHFYQNYDLNVMLSRKIFEEINTELIERSMNLVKTTLSEAKLSVDDIDDIVLVGGTTRIPKVQKCLSDIFNGRPLSHIIDPDEAVAVGAAIHAAMFNENQSVILGKFKLSDVNPHSLGIETGNQRFLRIIPKNTKIPAKLTKNICTKEDNQTQITIDIYEGENELIKDINLLGKITVKDIPADKAGAQKIDVTFELTDEGILIATAKVISTGQVKNTTIIAEKSGLTAEQLEKLIKEV